MEALEALQCIHILNGTVNFQHWLWLKRRPINMNATLEIEQGMNLDDRSGIDA